MAAAAPAVLSGLVTDAGLDRAWLSTLDGARERVVADSAAGSAPPVSATASTLTRRPGDEPARWVRAHLAPGAAPQRPTPTCLYRVAVMADGTPAGYLWGTRAREAGDPSGEETRLLALAADQLGLALNREALAREATAAEVAKQSEALKTALLDSVSHDLRTPLATIRAAAGALLDPALEWSAAQRQQTAQTIDNEAQRLDRIVHNVLDMSRLEAGVLRPEREVLPVDEVVRPVVDRLAGILGSRLSVTIPDDLPPVLVDAVYLDEALTNLLENAVHHGGPDVPVAVTARLGRTRGGSPSPSRTAERGCRRRRCRASSRSSIACARRAARRDAGWASASASSRAWWRRWTATSRPAAVPSVVWR